MEARWGPKLKWLAALPILLTVLQLLPVARRTNPPVQSEVRFDNHLRLNTEVSHLLQRACMDCHSNETRWPWYSRIAPLSWLVVRDVDRGRRVLNLSEWSRQAGKRPEIGASMLAAACTAAKSGRMPRFPYGIFHPEARLSPSDVQTLCDWTGSEVRRLIQLKRDQGTRLNERTRLGLPRPGSEKRAPATVASTECKPGEST